MNYNCNCKPVCILYNSGTTSVRVGNDRVNAIFSGNIFDNGFLNGVITYTYKNSNNEDVSKSVTIANQYTQVTEKTEKTTRIGDELKTVISFKDTFTVSDNNNAQYEIVCTKDETKICNETPWDKCIDMHNHCHYEMPTNHFEPYCPPHPMPNVPIHYYGNHHYQPLPPQYPYPTPRNWFPNPMPPHGMPYKGLPVIAPWYDNHYRIEHCHPHYVDMGEQPIYNDIYCW